MSNLPATQKKAPASVAFRRQAEAVARGLLSDWVGEARAGEAVGRIAVAITASAASSKKPENFYACSLQSVGSVVAISALTGIMPGHGPTALAYAIPRKLKGVWTLQYQLSHRGVNSLAGRAGQQMIAIPIGYDDEIQVAEDGECTVVARDIDNPPMGEDALRGILLVVKNKLTGELITKQWVAKALINKRRESSDAYKFAVKDGNDWAKESDPWHQWYVEQAQKTAMHYAIARGWCVVDDTEAIRALSNDSDLHTIDAKAVKQQTSAMSALEESMVPTSEPEVDGEPAETEPPAESSDEPEPEELTPYKRWRKTLMSEGDPDVLIAHAVTIDEDKSLKKDEKKVLAELITNLRDTLVDKD